MNKLQKELDEILDEHEFKVTNTPKHWAKSPERQQLDDERTHSILNTIADYLEGELPKPKQKNYMKEHFPVTENDEKRCKFYRYGGYDFALTEVKHLIDTLRSTK